MDIPFSNPSMANLGQILGNLAEPLALTGCLVTARYLDFLAAGGLAGYLAGKLARGSAGGKSVLTSVNGRVLVRSDTWVGLTLIWVFHNVA